MSKTNQPSNSHTVRKYLELATFIKAFAERQLNFLVLVGSPGLQKSTAVRDSLSKDVCWIEGHITAFGLYCRLHDSRNSLVVIDDVDELYRDQRAVRILKCLCQTDRTKRVAWESNAAALRRRNVATSFETTSRVLLISNDWKALTANVAALEDRAHVLQFVPTALEVHKRTAGWFWNQEVFDFVGRHLGVIDQPTMRDYFKADELAGAGLDWQAYLLQRWGLVGARLKVAQLKADASYATEEDRARAFAEQGGGCRATYFNHAKKLKQLIEPPAITLANDPPTDSHASDFDLLELLRKRHGGLGSG